MNIAMFYDFIYSLLRFPGDKKRHFWEPGWHMSLVSDLDFFRKRFVSNGHLTAKLLFPFKSLLQPYVQKRKFDVTKFIRVLVIRKIMANLRKK